MFSRRLSFLLSALFFLTAALPSMAGVKLGTITLGFGYVHHYPYSSPYAYDDPLYDPFVPYYPLAYLQNPSPDKGTIKLVGAEKSAEVYIDNAYAGRVSDLKTISIKPGAYNLELRSKGHETLQKRVYVLSGKTVRLEF